MLISILACSLGFHAITFERSNFYENRHFKNQASVVLNSLPGGWYRFLAAFLHVVAENVVTDRQTNGRKDGDYWH